jgi:chromosome segregation ATPase
MDDREYINYRLCEQRKLIDELYRELANEKNNRLSVIGCVQETMNVLQARLDEVNLKLADDTARTTAYLEMITSKESITIRTIEDMLVGRFEILEATIETLRNNITKLENPAHSRACYLPENSVIQFAPSEIDQKERLLKLEAAVEGVGAALATLSEYATHFDKSFQDVQQTLDHLDTRIDCNRTNCQESIEDLEGRLDSAEGTLNVWDEGLAEIESAVQDLEERFSSFEEDQVLCPRLRGETKTQFLDAMQKNLDNVRKLIKE